MKRPLVLIMTGLLLCSAPLWSQLPSTIGFQGVLGDGAGAAVADGSYSLTFRLYSQAAGGTPLWSETQLLDVKAGVFNAQLGGVTPMTMPFDRGYWLGISVDGGAELVPRTALTSVPYAFRAGQAGTAAALAPGATGVVTSLNGAEGALVLEGGGATTVSRSGGKITISSVGGSGGTGIQGVQSPAGSIAIQNGTGPIASLELADGAVTTAKLADGAVGPGKLAMSAVTGTTLADAAVTAAKLAPGAVTAGTIGAGAVVKGLTVGAVTLHDEVTLQAGANVTLTPTGNTVTIAATGGSGGTGIQGVQNTNQTLDILDGSGPVATINVSGSGIRTAHLADGAVTTAKLADAGVSEGKLAGNAVTTTKLADGAVTAAKLAAGLIPTTLPPSGAAGGALAGTYPDPELADNAVTSAKIAAGEVKSTDIADAAVTAAKISGKGASSGEVLVYNGSDVVWATPPSGGVSGSGSANQLALWNGASSLNGSGNLVYTGGKLGVGTASPSATLHVSGNEGVLAQGTYGSGTGLSPGAGTRMHWYPKKAAFRAGTISGTLWDDANIGAYSTAFGWETQATGEGSVAMGLASIASDYGAVALGYAATASDPYAFAVGYNADATGIYSISIGRSTTSSGNASVAIGAGATASGDNSIAMGSNVSTASMSGSFVFGDATTATQLTAGGGHSMNMRFAGGYRLFSNSALSTGVYMNGGVSGWTNYSDRNKKENFTAIDGEALLAKIRLLPVSEWNYKQTDPSIRYIGPMAQDFWQAFRLGGTDSLGINSIAIDGVNLAAVKALEARTSELREKTARIAQLEERLRVLEAQLGELATLRTELEAVKAFLLEQLPPPDAKKSLDGATRGMKTGISTSS